MDPQRVFLCSRVSPDAFANAGQESSNGALVRDPRSATTTWISAQPQLTVKDQHSSRYAPPDKAHHRFAALC
jgi:hypothetical protein